MDIENFYCLQKLKDRVAPSRDWVISEAPDGSYQVEAEGADQSVCDCIFMVDLDTNEEIFAMGPDDLCRIVDIGIEHLEQAWARDEGPGLFIRHDRAYIDYDEFMRWLKCNFKSKYEAYIANGGLKPRVRV